VAAFDWSLMEINLKPGLGSLKRQNFWKAKCFLLAFSALTFSLIFDK